MSSNYCLRVGLISHPFSLGIIETPVSSPYHLHLSYLHFFFQVRTLLMPQSPVITKSYSDRLLAQLENTAPDAANSASVLTDVN